ncbi:MAG TPA: Hpt domain-containing protein [Burkholderiaceae bacterium]
MNVESSDDLSALAWVQEELRRSLDAAHKSLRRFVKDTEALGETDIDAVDPAVLRSARNQVHQGVGALELIGLPTAANVLRASEAAVQRFVAKPHKLTNQAVDDIERASFGLLDYLARMLAGKPVSALALFPQYRAVQEAAGADRVHPADLWTLDWRWRELPTDPKAAPRLADEATQAALEAQLLALMRPATARSAAARMSDLCAELGAGAQGHVATLWKLASAVFEAQAHGLLGFDVFSKRVASRLLAQFRILERGDSEVSERLAQDLLFFCAQSASPGDAKNAPRLAAVRYAYDLAHHVPVDYGTSLLGRFDPALIAQARKRVTAAKEAWQAIAGGEMHRMSGLSEQFALVGDSLKRLFPLGEALAGELQQAVAATQQLGSAPPAPLAMEVATSLLYIEAALEDSDFDHPDQAARVQRLAQRLDGVRRGQPPEPLEPWMEELYRRVSDRQTMGSVVQELRASLGEAEKLIDQFFRKPDDRNVLIDVPHQLSAMRGVLSVLGMDHASAALLRMRDEVDGLIATEVDPQRIGQAGVFDRLAGNLGALGFLIDMLSVQPQMAKSLFRFDAATGVLSPVMGREAPAAPPPVEPRLIEQAQQLAFTSVREDVAVEDVTRDLERLSQEAQAADQPALAAVVAKAQEALDHAVGSEDQAAVRGELSDALADFVSTASDPVGLDPAAERKAADALPAAKAADGAVSAFAGLDEDDEMREIFLEEAREVIANAESAQADLVKAPDDIALLTTLRRAFHTLKGSSRMVGLKEFGEAAWACEQLYNSHLAEQRAAAAPFLDFTAWSLAELGAWVDDIAARRDASRSAAAIRAAAQRAGEEQAEASADPVSDIALPLTDVPLEVAPPVAPAASLPAAQPDQLQPLTLDFADALSSIDLDLRVEPPPARHAPAASADADAVALPELSFELDLGSLDLPPAEATPVAEVPPVEALHEPPATDQPIPLDLGAHALIEPFGAELHPATEPVPLAEVVELPMPAADVQIETITLDGTAAPVDERAVAEAPQAASEDDNVKIVGALRIGIPLFNIYLNEADELSRRLSTEIAEWAMELHRPIGETPIALAHSLAGSSATVGFADLSQLARSLEHAQMRSQAIGQGTTDEAQLFADTAEEIRHLLHQFAAGFLKAPAPELLARLAEHEISSARRLDAVTAAEELEPVASIPGELGGLESAGIETITFDDLAAVGEAPVEPVPVEPVEATATVPPTSPAPLAPLTTPAALPDSSDSHFGGLGVAELKPLGELPVETHRHAPASASSADTGLADDDTIDAVDAVDAELFPIFEEEAEELLPQLASRLRDWARKPGDGAHPASCMRTLHTLKGGARLAGAMRLGEMAHRLETRIEHLLAAGSIEAADVEALQAYGDGLQQTFEALRERDARAYTEATRVAEAAQAAAEAPAPVAPPPVAAPAEPLQVLLQEAPRAVSDSGYQRLDGDGVTVPAGLDPDMVPTQPSSFDTLPPAEVLSLDVGDTSAAPTADAAPIDEAAARSAAPPEVDWSRFAGSAAATVRKGNERAQIAQSAVRVRAPLLDRLVNLAGEVSITRSRVESGVTQLKSSLGDLTENLERLRAQLRDIEFHGETQMTSRLEAAKAASQSFDPLEFDRFTRFQELTRMMAESVNDVATVQRTLQRSIETAEDELVAQARLTRDLQDDLLRTRMVEFEGLSDRLYRVVRLAAKETGKSVRLDIVGGSIEVDRGVLDRMTGSFEHLLRNCVTHGIEMPDARSAAGKDPTGSIIVALTHEGNEVGVEFRDDGAGLNLARIREKGRALGLVAPDADISDAEAANLIFTPGFSTAEQVTELAGRGVGMDVVRSDVNAMGGRVETATAAGQGTSFKLILPLTTAVTQVVMLRCGETSVAVPSTLIEIVRRASPNEVDAAYVSGTYTVGERTLPFFWLGALLQVSARSAETGGRTRSVVVVRSAQQRIALHVDEVLGNQEVVVKNLGPQLATVPGLAGVTLLASGAVALIYNPVALATLYGDSARLASQAAGEPSAATPQVPTLDQPLERQAPLVMVVDDSLTVRRVTQRLLLREGYRVVLAKDGLDALERLAEEKPQIVLSDIEMPRMDGFDLVRNMRADARLAGLPVIMITSRIAQKHRDYAAELGVDHYLGKPYSEEDLLALIARYTAADSQIAVAM